MIDEQRLNALVAAARTAATHAYCPYSHYPVGAVVLTENGGVFSGCNVENASYGLTICGERNAIFRAVAEGDRNITAVVIYTPTATPVLPCGACRQVIFEFGPKAEVISACSGRGMIRKRLPELLPEPFISRPPG